MDADIRPRIDPDRCGHPVARNEETVLAGSFPRVVSPRHVLDRSTAQGGHAMSFTVHDPSPTAEEPRFDCIFCDKPALVSSEAARTETTRTVEVFCRHCGARKTVATRKSADGNRWEMAD